MAKKLTLAKPAQINVTMPEDLYAHVVQRSITVFGRVNAAAFVRRLINEDRLAHPPATVIDAKPFRDTDPRMVDELMAWGHANMRTVFRESAPLGSHWRWSGMRGGNAPGPTPTHSPMADDGTLLRDWLYKRYRLQDHVDQSEYTAIGPGHSAVPVCGHPTCINPRHLRPGLPVAWGANAPIDAVIETFRLSPLEVAEITDTVPDGPPLLDDDGVVHPGYLR